MAVRGNLSRGRHGPQFNLGGIDTNVLVRFLVGDDPDQASRAAAMFARATAEGERLFVAGEGDLADWLIWERSRAAVAGRVVTFDLRLLRSPEFAEVTP